MSTQLERGIELYESGKYAEAFEILLPLAQQGDIEAQCRASEMYDDGIGVEKNEAEAFKWLMAAAGQRQAYTMIQNSEASYTGKYLKKKLREIFEALISSELTRPQKFGPPKGKRHGQKKEHGTRSR